jgi:hypothetical protein
VFAVRDTRAATVLSGLLTDAYAGVVVCDWAKMYWGLGRLQWCWAHLARDFQALADSEDGVVKRLGHDLLRPTRELFRQWSRCRDGTISRAELNRCLAPVRRAVEGLLLRGLFSGQPRLVGMCRELYEHRVWLWTFLEQEVEPTNNASERALRHAVIWRKLSFGTQSAGGSRFVETMLFETASVMTSWVGRQARPPYRTSACCRHHARRRQCRQSPGPRSTIMRTVLAPSLLLSVCLFATFPAAQEKTPPAKQKDPQSEYEPTSRPGEGQKFLRKFVGDWDVAKTFHPRSGEPVRQKGECRQTMIHGGRFLQSDFTFYRGDDKTTGTGLVGFDPAAGLFTSVWIDARSTRMSFRQGREKFDGKQIVLYSRSLGGDGKKERVSRTVTRLEEDGRRIVHRQYTAGEGGRERLVMELILSKRDKKP